MLISVSLRQIKLQKFFHLGNVGYGTERDFTQISVCLVKGLHTGKKLIIIRVHR